MINNPLGQRCPGHAVSNVPSLAMSQWHFPAAQQLQPTQKKKTLCHVRLGDANLLTAHTSLPTLKFTAGLHLGSEGWASWQSPVWAPQSALGSTAINWVQPRVVFILILTNQLIRVQNNILKLGKSFWLWKILKFILVFLAQTTWRLSAKPHKTN